MRFSRAIAVAVVATALAGCLPPLAPAAGAPVPTAITPPFGFPFLEGAQVKVELGFGGPSGDATSYAGTNGADVNFSVWWWDTGPATNARLVLDLVNYAMSPAPVGDGDNTNGTLYVVKVPVASFAAGEHTWHFDFTGPSGAFRLPATGENDKLRLDRADRFLTNNLMVLGRQVNFTYRTTPSFTLREAVNRTMVSVDPQMGTSWDAVEGYPYADHNRYIISPSAATSTNHEAFVTATGASRARFADSGTFPNNSQPAIKQAVLLRGALLATGLFNESDIAIETEEMVMNITTYRHPFLRVALNDGSELPGDGPVDGDGWMDVDLWGIGLSTAVVFGSHFNEDYNTGDDALWDGTVGWPPALDSNTDVVLAPYLSIDSLRAPDGSMLDFYLWESTVTAATTTPVQQSHYWADDPMLFDGLSSVQSVGVDLTYEWTIESTVWSALGPVWTQSIPAVGNYAVTLTVRDTFGEQDSVLIQFSLDGRTKSVVQIPDITFPEDGRHALDLRVFFGDADGFDTIQFGFTVNPPGTVAVERTPSFAPTINLTVAQDWCGNATLQVTATDGTSPQVSQEVNLTVTCVNDRPQIVGLPTLISFDEDTPFPLGPMRVYATDDDGDTLVWSFSGTVQVTAQYDSMADTLVFRAPSNWNGLNTGGSIYVTDGTETLSRNVVVTVNATNDPPTTLGIPTLVATEDDANATFALSQYFSDVDGESDALSAEVTPYAGVEAGFSTLLRQVWYHPTANFNGQASFALRVWDGAQSELELTVNVTVAPVNDPPLIDRVTPPGYGNGAEGDTLAFAAFASDPDDATLVYAFELDGQSQGQSFDGTFSWTADYQAAGMHTVKVTVTDGSGATAEHTWQIQLSGRNRAPTASIIRPAAASFEPGQAIALSAEAADPDGDALTYTWSFGGFRQPVTGPNVSVSFNAAGTYPVRLTVSDGALQVVETTEVLVIYVIPPDQNHNNTTDDPPINPPFLSGPEAGAAIAALAGAAALFVFVARRRR